ncbi:MAG: DUF3488 and transglutaminase-like domain-containing protein [Deltaproteobacteria bacterium]|nr:DUF3488 and transglutaminase-like domain-containing protein [Deltaproteobacteria bacterium]
MRFSRVHKFSVYAVAVLGLLALASGGALQGPIGLLIALGVVASWWAEGALLESRVYAQTQTGLLLFVMVLQTARVTMGGHNLLDAAVEFAALLQVSRLAFRRSAGEYQQSTALALAHLIAATVLGAGISYAVCFMGFVITLPWALTLGHLRREIEGNYLADARAGRAGVPIDVARILRSRRVVGVGLLAGSSLLSVPIFAMTALLFVLFPRIGLGVFSLRSSRGTATAGLGDQVDLSGHGTIRDDPTIVLRVEPPQLGDNPPASRVFRLRGAAFDFYNGHAWTRSSSHRIGVLRDMGNYDLHVYRGRERELQAYRLTLDGLDPPVLLLPPGSVRVRIEPRMEAGYPRYPELTRDHANEVRYGAQDDLGLVYTALVPRAIADDLGQWTSDREPLNERERASYLQLPSLSPRVLSLAHELTDEHAQPMEKARAIERYLRAMRYTLTIESGDAAHPIEDFLFRTHAGHCEYFSTAMALLLRAVDVPTRNVTGFLGGTFNAYGRFYAIRQGDAHSWVEAYTPDQGWVTFDPTPSAREPARPPTGLLAELDAVLEAMRARWRRYIVGFDLSSQLKLFQGAFRWMEWGRTSSSASNRASLRQQARGTESPEHSQRNGRIAVAVLAIAGLAGVLWFVRKRRDITPAQRAIRDSRTLVSSLDLAFERMGHRRPSSRSPVAHASALPLPAQRATLHEAAARWALARYGNFPLTEQELSEFQRQLRALTPPSPTAPPEAP